MINRFKNEFRENIAILHSKLTNKERADEWYNICLLYTSIDDGTSVSNFISSLSRIITYNVEFLVGIVSANECNFDSFSIDAIIDKIFSL